MGQLIYLYGFIPGSELKENPLKEMKGFDDEGSIFTISAGKVEAVVCELDDREFSEQVLQEKTENDIKWLQEKALHHHHTIMALYEQYTLIPLKFCTIYKSKERLHQTVETKKEQMEAVLEQIKGREEWNLKIYCEDTQLKEDISKNSPLIEAKKKEINQLSPGRRFFEMKKIDSLVEEELEKEKNKICEEVHERMRQFATDATVKKNWSKEMTGRKENMCWNSIYFLEQSQVETFVEEMGQKEMSLNSKGFTLELTGPWPAYHFAV
ncbi:Gas vesicle synthesis protein GvpL/GvpF [Gracilibacillus ureilyticus]|uniref:Gas vesicle synthesis protein GvpL/GvpF n=1 Tax=Gracilibacillus ureilyticus TaxID=531814 RepID=A0A1H9PA86_9BACI|nr:GvpL/GvpF family gas vesicle protein [Gracilibacillus ureilyticus]SER45021.1 Gas vesicle synthesis protein GvpL/GvpF [Gracilibacillus ureilyticus]